MTNYEWVKENQEDVIQKALASNMVIHKNEVINMIVNNDDVVKESIMSYCNVDTHTNKIVMGELEHMVNSNYLVSYNAVAEWLDKERLVPLEPACPIGTILVGDDDNWYWYVGIDNSGKNHVVVSRVTDINKAFAPSSLYYTDDGFRKHFRKLNPRDDLDFEINLVIAK